MSYFEAELIHHAAPTLLGRKQANLFSIPLEQFSDYKSEIQRYQKQLSQKGIHIVYLYSCQKRVFLLVYREKYMYRTLCCPAVKKYLCQIGYRLEAKQKYLVKHAIQHLRNRMIQYHEFPHEIGFFLGYPIADVFSFIREKGQNYKRVGYWKVYGDEQKALRIFQCYEDCREALQKQVLSGMPILSLLATA